MIDIMFEFRFVSTDISYDMLFGYSEWSLFVMLDQLFRVKHFFLRVNCCNVKAKQFCMESCSSLNQGCLSNSVWYIIVTSPPNIALSMPLNYSRDLHRKLIVVILVASFLIASLRTLNAGCLIEFAQHQVICWNEFWYGESIVQVNVDRASIGLWTQAGNLYMPDIIKLLGNHSMEERLQINLICVCFMQLKLR